MKKLISLYICIFIMFSYISALADETVYGYKVDDEILFNNLAWGTN